jgi:hypothetical protein
VLLARELGLVGRQRVAIDGTFFDGNASKGSIKTWEHEDVLERHRARMKDASEQMRLRAALAEHPFGTLKCRAGYRHFLVRGFDKVRGEWSLMALCYNFSRVLSIIGFDGFTAYLARRARSIWRLRNPAAAVRSPATASTALLRTHSCKISKVCSSA